jgi:hypothetical protein
MVSDWPDAEAPELISGSVTFDLTSKTATDTALADLVRRLPTNNARSFDIDTLPNHGSSRRDMEVQTQIS